MTNPIEVVVLVTISNGRVTLASTDLESDAVGFFHELARGSTETVEVQVKGKSTADHALITRVRSVPTPDSGSGPWTDWNSTGSAFVSPAWVLGSEFRIEVHNSAAADPEPEGGGHFRVVEEGGGGALGAA